MDRSVSILNERPDVPPPERERLKQILLVEDDPGQLRTLTDLLLDEGFEVTTCSTGKAALERIQQLSVGVAIVDLRLPDLEGPHLFAEMRKYNDQVRIIIHTAYGTFDSAKAAVNSGVFAYVEKLGDPEELLREVHRAVRDQLDEYADQLESRVRERTQSLTEANRRLQEEITERQRAEAELQRAHDQLETRVEERTADLQQVNELLLKEIDTRKNTEEALRKEERLLKQLLDLHESERQLFAYEIHDGLAQYVAGAKLRLEGVLKQHPIEDDELRDQCEWSLELLRHSINEARRLITGLRPPILDEQGVVAAIDHLLEDRYQNPDVEVNFQSSLSTRRLEPILESAIFRMVQEGLTNIRRHSQAKKARIELLEYDSYIRLKIMDRGRGFDLEQLTDRNFGLHGMQERARLLGGVLSIQSEPGKGTHLIADLPILERSEAIRQPSTIPLSEEIADE
ncbi:Hypothetical protein PBC10988_28650 [Planctomycetales bacterium 10988]|nr:Hypothetical protein PBC10988_28650 [Planctomycetales bacterium 10988]